ncbi:MAG: hypothetical protein NW226_05970 [Microscillaceae bacterium]|nr:hypothetical protein [Microscillaceae bacterium]
MEKTHKYAYKDEHYPRLENKTTDMSKPWIMRFYLLDIQKGKPALIRHKNSSIKDFHLREKYFEKVGKEFKRLMDEGYAVNAGKVEKEAFALPLMEAIEEVLAHKKRYLAESSYKDDLKFKNAIKEWMEAENKQYFLAEITRAKAYKFLDWLREARNFGNRTHKNYKMTGHSVFEYFVKRKTIQENPFEEIESGKIQVNVHMPFTYEQKEKIFEAIKATGDAQFWFFTNICYYTCARPHAEVRLLKVGDIFERTIRFKASDAKSREGLHVRIAKPLKAIIDTYALNQYPEDAYIFGRDGEPGEVPVFDRYFSRRFRKCLNQLGFGKDYDLYGLKHTRIIFLMEKVTKFTQLKEIQELARHKTLSQTEEYARKFGVIFPFNSGENSIIDEL